jgi:uncharacterized protein (DUF1800 family)
VTLQALSSNDPAIAVGRFGLGARPGELTAASARPRAWLKAQITPAGADQPAGSLPSSRDGFAAYLAFAAEARRLRQRVSGQQASGADDSADQFKAERQKAREPLRQAVLADILARARLAAATPAPFRERWALFWANHFTVSTNKPQAATLAGPFEREAIRPHVFGRFEDLLVASSTHPGMMLYLDQARSTGPNSLAGRRREAGLNENLAREIMELHTVGPDAGYTQADVTEFARALTGYSVGVERDGPEAVGAFIYRPNLHEPGARTIMGRRYSQNGEAQARAILASLSDDPHTADHLARKLAVHFVADDPPPRLVERLRGAFRESRGDLAVVAAALIDSPDAWGTEPRKFKRPYEFLISSYRALGALPASAPEVAAPLTQLGERPFAAPQPNGWSEQIGDWAAPDAIVKRLDWASRFAAARAPDGAAPADLAESALGARLTPATRLAVARAETRPEALTLLLMSPEFLYR